MDRYYKLDRWLKSPLTCLCKGLILKVVYFAVADWISMFTYPFRTTISKLGTMAGQHTALQDRPTIQLTSSRWICTLCAIGDTSWQYIRIDITQPALNTAINTAYLIRHKSPPTYCIPFWSYTSNSHCVQPWNSFNFFQTIKRHFFLPISGFIIKTYCLLSQYTFCSPCQDLTRRTKCVLKIKLKVLWYGIKVNFSLKKELKPKFLLSCFVKLAPGAWPFPPRRWPYILPCSLNRPTCSVK